MRYSSAGWRPTSTTFEEFRYRYRRASGNSRGYWQAASVSVGCCSYILRTNPIKSPHEWSAFELSTVERGAHATGVHSYISTRARCVATCCVTDTTARNRPSAYTPSSEADAVLRSSSLLVCARGRLQEMSSVLRQAVKASETEHLIFFASVPAKKMTPIEQDRSYKFTPYTKSTS